VIYFTGKNARVSKSIPLAYAEAKYQKLLLWADTLALELGETPTTLNHTVFVR